MNIGELSKTQISFFIDEYIFNQRDREILKRRLFDGVKYEDLAWEFDLSVRQTKSIIYKSQEKLFKIIEKAT